MEIFRTELPENSFVERSEPRGLPLLPPPAVDVQDDRIEYEILGRDDGKIVAEVFLERTR